MLNLRNLETISKAHKYFNSAIRKVFFIATVFLLQRLVVFFIRSGLLWEFSFLRKSNLRTHDNIDSDFHMELCFVQKNYASSTTSLILNKKIVLLRRNSYKYSIRSQIQWRIFPYFLFSFFKEDVYIMIDVYNVYTVILRIFLVMLKSDWLIFAS